MRGKSPEFCGSCINTGFRAGSKTSVGKQPAASVRKWRSRLGRIGSERSRQDFETDGAPILVKTSAAIIRQQEKRAVSKFPKSAKTLLCVKTISGWPLIISAIFTPRQYISQYLSQGSNSFDQRLPVNYT